MVEEKLKEVSEAAVFGKLVGEILYHYGFRIVLKEDAISTKFKRGDQVRFIDSPSEVWIIQGDSKELPGAFAIKQITGVLKGFKSVAAPKQLRSA